MPTRLPAFSIRLKVLASTVVVLLSVATYMAVYYPSRHETSARAELRQRTRGTAEMVSLSVGIGLRLNQLGAVTAALNWAKRDPTLVYVLVADSSGETFAEYNPTHASVEVTASGTVVDSIIERDGMMQIAVPVAQQEPQSGTLYLGMSLSAMRGEVAAFRSTALIVSFLALVLGGVVALYFADRITRPLRELQVAAQRVAEGDYSTPPSTDGTDEVGRLSQVFRVMIERIRSSRDQLEHQAQQLTEARDQALDAARAKASFLAAMSHEIRTPMNGVLGMLSLLGDTPLTSTSADGLLRVIGDILDSSKIEAGKLDMEQVDFDLRTTVEDVAALLAEQAHAKNLELNCVVDTDVPGAVSGDPTRLRQILLNLGGNAVKFTVSGEVTIRVHFEAGTEDGVTLRFEVTDTGIGMQERTLERLFEPFSQADSSTTRQFGGTGLGLSIARRLVELMGGTLGVESMPGVGSRFWFAIRVALAAAPSTPPRWDRLDGTRVLVVEDNLTCQDLLRHYLEPRGIRLTVTGSAEEAAQVLAVALANHALPHLALIDAALPGTSGASFGQEIRRDPRFASLRLILLTPVGGRDDAVTVGATDFDGYLSKPIGLHALCQCIAAALAGDAAPIQNRGPRTQPVRAPGGALAESRERPRILVAEDHPINQLLAVEVLQLGGYRVTVVNNGAEAVEARFRDPYDVVLMDCQMPVMDGFDATGAIRRKEAEGNGTDRIPIIALTANAIEGDRVACLAAGMDDYLSKPFAPADLLSITARWIRASASKPQQSAADSPAKAIAIR
jgi:two-component system sensor histidine kinase/response regulator